jgi:hypothetical protein
MLFLAVDILSPMRFAVHVAGWTCMTWLPPEGISDPHRGNSSRIWTGP